MSIQPETMLPAAEGVADLKVYLLGPPKVLWGGDLLTVPRRQTRALLYRLAAHLQPVSRQRLCFLFWPNVPESSARRNLTHLLTHLRRALPDPEILQTSEDFVALDPRRVWSDTASFERWRVALPREPQPLREVEDLEALQRAVELYGGPFLADFSLPANPEFEMWAAQERRSWERIYLEALEALLEGWTARGEYDAAIACARRYLETDELAEDVHRRLMALYAAVGDRGAALRQFERCVAVLERELGVSPLPETRAIYQEILDGHPPPLQRPVVSPAWTTLPSLEVPLMGRDEAWQLLEQAYARARAGHGGVVLISGEAGIGKSRLMQDFATRLQGQALVLVGTGHFGARTTPYQPLVEALRPVLSDGKRGRGDGGSSSASIPSLLHTVSPVWLAEASRLLPELQERIPDLPRLLPSEPEEARPRLFEALCRIVLGLADGPRPVLLCLDDLHWADSATLDWLAYLACRIHGRRLLILGAYRCEEADALGGLRHSLARAGRLSELGLTGLDAETVLRLLRHLVGPIPGDEALARRLQQATGGNPFYLLETVRALLEANQPLADLTHLENFPLSDPVRQALEARLSHLSPRARQILEAGAILGTSFDFDLVRLTAGRGELETLDGLDELVARQLLVEEASGYRFQHDLTRRAVEVGLSPVRRQLLHRRAGRAWEQLRPDAAATLAYHFDAGGEVAKALRYYAQAAQQATELFAWQEAEEYQSRALALLHQLDPACSDPTCLAQRGRMLADRAHLRFLQGRLADRDADLAEMAALAEESGDDGLRLQALIHRARYLNLDGRYEEAIATAEEGIALAERMDDASARSCLLAQLGFAHYFRGEYQAAMEPLLAALALEPADPAARGEVLSVLSYAYYLIADYERSLDYRRQALSIRSELGLLARVAEDLTDMGILHTRLNRLPEAEQYLTRALSLAREIGSQPAESYALNNLGNLHYLRGDYPAALACYADSLGLQRATGSRRGEASALGNSGMVLLAMGDYAAAESFIRQSLAIQEEIGYKSGLVEGLAHLAQALIGQGRFEEARAAVERSLEMAREIGDRYGQVTALNVLAGWHLEREEPAEALRWAEEAVRIAGEAGLVHGRILGLAALGLARLMTGDAGAALACTAQAVALLQEQGCIEGPEERVYLAHSRVLAALGRRQEACMALSRARAEVWSKAAHITDPVQRRRYLRSWRSRALSRL
ncbi:MAG: tetratricopeptide repeat protein [Chloroflexi bacterium]|nr:tetratricopeptide repeat protein [Chloroflexota bacterium]